jgi:hypothetical protein
MDRPAGRVAYRAVRDIPLRHRDDYDAAVAAFRWPDMGATNASGASNSWNHRKSPPARSGVSTCLLV